MSLADDAIVATDSRLSTDAIRFGCDCDATAMRCDVCAVTQRGHHPTTTASVVLARARPSPTSRDGRARVGDERTMQMHP